MNAELHFLVILLWSLIGGLLTGLIYDAVRRDPTTGVWIGALAAGLGAALPGAARESLTLLGGLLFLIPLWIVLAVIRSPSLARLERGLGGEVPAILRDSKTWQSLTLVAAAEFLLYFFLPRWDGLVSLWDMIWGAIRSLPDFFGGIIDYFQAVPTDQLWASIRAGGLFGAAATVLIFVLGVYPIHIPLPTPGRLLSFYRARSRPSHSSGLHTDLPRWSSFTTAREHTVDEMRHFPLGSLLIAAGAGAVAGALGAQILLYPVKHCTYAPGLERAEYRMGLVVTALSALLLLVPLWTLLRSRSGPRTPDRSGHFHNIALPYLFLLPTLIILILFLYYPAVQIMLTSLQRKIFPLPQAKFSCMANYVSLKDDQVYRDSFMSTLQITGLIVIFSLIVALAIAVLASQKVKGASIYRTLLIWPYAISPVVTGVIFLSMFQEGGIGVLNWAIKGFMDLLPNGLADPINSSMADLIPGWPEPHWFKDASLAPWGIVAAAVWNLLGFNILFYIAGLQNIPEDLLEAASLDGANRFTRFWRITFPLLSPFTFFLLVTNITYSFYGIYGVVDTLMPSGGPRLETAGGQSGATNVLIFKLYNDSFNTGTQAGIGAAQAVMLFLMVAAFTILQFRFIERRVTYEA